MKNSNRDLLRKKRYIFLSFFFLFAAGTFSLSAEEKFPISLQEKRTEFTRTGNCIDTFFDSLQAKILYSFSRASGHFMLIFESAGKEGSEKAKEKIAVIGEEAVKSMQKQTEKVIRETLDNEMNKIFPGMKKSGEKKSGEKMEKASGKAASENPVPPQQSGSEKKKKDKEIQRKKEEFSLPELPELPEVPHAP